MARIGIAGAGVLGRLLAWQLSRAGHHVTVFDPAPGPQAPAVGQLAPASHPAAGFTAAGMLSPIAELDNAGPDIARLGWRSLALWRGVADALRADGCSAPLFAQHGSLMLSEAHHGITELFFDDPAARQRAREKLAGSTTSLREILGQAPDFAVLAAALVAGFEEEYGLPLIEQPFDSGEEQAVLALCPEFRPEVRVTAAVVAGAAS